MLGCYDFCGHYDWTFAWLAKKGGDSLLQAYWQEAISKDSQRHARQLIVGQGIEGMRKYWGHTLAEESPEMGYQMAFQEDRAWIQFHACPSRGFLINNQIQFSSDYCDHCIAWIRPVLEEAGFSVDHEHNHCGQCWWHIAKQDSGGQLPAPGEPIASDIRLSPSWKPVVDVHHRFRPSPGDPTPATESPRPAE